MLEAFEKRIRDVQLRCSVNLLLEQTAMALITAGAIGAFAVLTEKLFAVEIVNNWFAAGLAAVCLAGVALRLPLFQRDKNPVVRPQAEDGQVQGVLLHGHRLRHDRVVEEVVDHRDD